MRVIRERTIFLSTRRGFAVFLLGSCLSCGESSPPPGPSPIPPSPPPPLDEPLPVAGAYSLTMAIDDECREFPADFRVRAYEVDVVPEGTHSRLTFANPAVFPVFLACVCGRVRAGEMLFDLEFYEGTASFIVLYEVHGAGVLADGSIHASMGGRISFNDDANNAVECISGQHRLTLTPL